ncbi:uncharacterized protein LOC114946115 [Nylanderia fulva]|uniref:uncharacterized protein LOC114946115 n=1 Tax=Nylanderia fulva TaxID=613905 RepID=UPI0010FAE743|nr:uncharacterized protein LOC114946115 [Nylanderia fulva]
MLQRMIKEESNASIATKAKKMSSSIKGEDQSDPCVFVDNTETTPTIVMVYVDDIIIASKNSGRVNMIKAELSRRFKIKDLGPAKYCLGFEIHQQNSIIKLSQAGYIREILNKFGMSECKSACTPLAVSSKFS